MKVQSSFFMIFFLFSAVRNSFIFNGNLLLWHIQNSVPSVRKGKGNNGNQKGTDCTYAFLPQMDPLYQALHVLKYFFLVPMTCWRNNNTGGGKCSL